MDLYLTTIVKPHGLMGKVKVKGFEESLYNLVLNNEVHDQHDSYNVYNIESLSGNNLIFSIKNIDSYDSAKKLVGKKLYINRAYLEPLDENEYYVEDLIDAEVVLSDGKLYGKVVQVYNFGAGDILEVQLSNSSKMVMYPFIKDIFLDSDFNDKRIVIKPPEIIEEND